MMPDPREVRFANDVHRRLVAMAGAEGVTLGKLVERLTVEALRSRDAAVTPPAENVVPRRRSRRFLDA